MQWPAAFLESLAGLPGYDPESFAHAHNSEDPVTSIRLNPGKPSPLLLTHSGIAFEPVPWTQMGYYLNRRPSFTFDPLFHAGCYYVQEASSMLLEQALTQTLDLSRSLRVLDLCGAPGGKSTHIQSLISPHSLLVSNEVIRTRAGILKENMIRWGARNVMVTNNDPEDFSELVNYFDCIVVDAPCSGSGLFRKEPDAMKEWSPNHVQLCSKRQQRILADALPALSPGGILIYSTCSYAPEENEEIVEWLVQEQDMEYLPLSLDLNWGITQSESGYRCWPGAVKGEGFFLACFRKKSLSREHTHTLHTTGKPVSPGKKELELINTWVDGSDLQYIRHENIVYAWPDLLVSEFSNLLRTLKVIYSGIRLGELIRDKMIPDHALALSGKVKASIPRTDLSYDQAIRYLQRKDLDWKQEGIGWMLVTYQKVPLGWVNVLQTRINNYYPKELRILKDR